MNFFKMTASPHMHGNESTRRIMLDVIVSLLPALVWGIYGFGTRAFTVTAVCVVSCVLSEYLYRKLMKKNSSIGDLSAVVTGLLLALTLPVSVPLWCCILGSVFAIIIVKQLYGGIGKNVVNPALAARAFLFAAFPQFLSGVFTPFCERFSFIGLPSDINSLACATPLSQEYSMNNMFSLFIGSHAGSIGEISELLLLLGGIYLICRKVITWHIPVAYIGTVALISVIFPAGGVDNITFMLGELLSGGLFIGAIFMATDYVTSPATPWGRIIYGFGCGLLTMFIRYFGGYPEGVSFAILIMNLLVWYIDMFTRPKPFGGVKNAKAK